MDLRFCCSNEVGGWGLEIGGLKLIKKYLS